MTTERGKQSTAGSLPHFDETIVGTREYSLACAVKLDAEHLNIMSSHSVELGVKIVEQRSLSNNPYATCKTGGRNRPRKDWRAHACAKECGRAYGRAYGRAGARASAAPSRARGEPNLMQAVVDTRRREGLLGHRASDLVGA